MSVQHKKKKHKLMNTVMTETNKKHKNQIKLQNEHKKLCTKKMCNPLVN